jgi:ELP3 family radical SAM enzyme/protein acetyltransferase
MACPSSIYDPKFATGFNTEDIENVFSKEFSKVEISDADMNTLEQVFTKSHSFDFKTNQDYMKFMNREAHNRFAKTKMIQAYRILLSQNKIKRNPNLERFMKFKNTRGNSGILQVTNMMSGQLFGVDSEENIKNGGCPHKCIYCPLEIIDGVITQPRSYVSPEPVNQRALQNKHHPVAQTFDRLRSFEKMGHLSSEPENPAKIEFMISGGTFNFFPLDYIMWYTTLCYYALNVYYDYTMTGILRDPLSLEEEQKINETASIRMIGLTIETRPDYLDMDVIRFFRRLGVTRVQIGTQHTDDKILKMVKRDCTDAKNQQGNTWLMDNCFKVDNHWMLDLYGSSKKKDLEMIDYLFNNPNYAVDQIKIYPTMVIQHSELYDMYQSGEYKPYAEENDGNDIQEVIMRFLEKVPYYIRVNRVIRDFYAEAVVGGVRNGDMRKNVEDKLRERGVVLKDIRCREIKDGEFDEKDCHLFVQKYESCGGINHFISYENKARTKLYGFVRLRFNKSDKYTLPELIGHAFIRELHVYGVHTGVGDANDKKTQHRGLGKMLLAKAEEIAALNGYEQITVISGVGVKEYYRKRGYSDYHTYLTKQIDLPLKYHLVSFVLAMFVLFCAFIMFVL